MTEKLLTGTSNKKNKPKDSKRAGVEEKCWNQNNLKTLLCRFYTRHFKKCGVLCYSARSKIKLRSSARPYVCLSVCLSVRPSYRPSVRPAGWPAALRFHSLLGAFFFVRCNKDLGQKRCDINNMRVFCKEHPYAHFVILCASQNMHFNRTTGQNLRFW